MLKLKTSLWSRWLVTRLCLYFISGCHGPKGDTIRLYSYAYKLGDSWGRERHDHQKDSLKGPETRLKGVK